MWMTCVSNSKSFEASGARARFAAAFTAMRLTSTLNIIWICFLYQKNDLDIKKCRIGLLLIDVFSRKAVVVPIASKQPADITAGIMEALNKLGGKPKLIYSDDEGSLNTQDLVDFFKDEGIQNYKTRGRPHFAERFIRTFKDMLFKRVDAGKG